MADKPEKTKTGPRGPMEIARAEALQGDEKWQLEMWASGPDGGALKITTMLRSEPSAMVLRDLRARLAGQYRLQYQEWADKFGHKAIQKG